MARRGMPSPQFALKGKTCDPGVTNVRNTASPHWRRGLGPSNRCLVPFTSFSECEAGPDGKKVPVWFALDDNRPLAAFSGIWTNWTSVRKTKEGEVTADRPIRVPDHGAERGRRSRPPEGNAGDLDDGGQVRHLAAGAGGRGHGASEAAGGRDVESRCEGTASGRFQLHVKSRPPMTAKRDFPVYKVRRYLEPGPIVLVSSRWRGKTNIMTMGWHTVMEFAPSLIGCVIASAMLGIAA